MTTAASDNVVQQFPPASADLTTAWAFLEEGINHIMTKPQTGISSENLMGLYVVVYNYCTSGGVRGAVDSALDSGNRKPKEMIGSDLYNNLILYLVACLKGLREQSDFLQDETLLRYYASEWDRYTIGASYIDRGLTYLNRHWVKREREEGRKTVYPVYTLALVLWKTTFFSYMQSNLAGAILGLVERERNGETIDHNLVKKVVDTFISLDINDTDLNTVSLNLYREYFEIPFLEATGKYYEQESKAFLAENSVPDYLKKVMERLQEEEDRVDRYLNARTRKRLISKCERVLIRPHAELMWGSFRTLLDHDRDEDLQRMYVLLSRIPGGLEPLRRIFEEHMKKVGQIAVSKLVGERTESADGLVPKAYVDSLFDVHVKNSERVSRCFKGDAGFVISLDQACREFMNRNAATGTSAQVT